MHEIFIYIIDDLNKDYENSGIGKIETLLSAMVNGWGNGSVGRVGISTESESEFILSNYIINLIRTCNNYALVIVDFARFEIFGNIKL